jgi:hypothetical protein
MDTDENVEVNQLRGRLDYLRQSLMDGIPRGGIPREECRALVAYIDMSGDRAARSSAKHIPSKERDV